MTAVAGFVRAVAIESGENGAWVVTDGHGDRWLTADPELAAVIVDKVARYGLCIVSSPLTEMP